MIRMFLLAILIVAGSLHAQTIVPFRTDTGRPMIQLHINGKGPFPFVFDTGMPGVMVMRSLVDELDLEVIGQEQIQSPAQGTPVTADIVRIGSVEVNGLKRASLDASVLDMSGPGLGQGVIGPIVFETFGPMTIDFAQNTITVGAGHPPPGITSWMAFGPSAPLLDVEVKLAGYAINGHIDTGNPGLLALPDAFASQIPLTGPLKTIGKAKTIDKEFEIRSAPTQVTATIGDATIRLQEVTFQDVPVANLGTAGCSGLILHIDWKKRRFGLVKSYPGVPGAISQARPAGNGPRFGMMAHPQSDGTLAIAGTEPGSVAEKMGLLAGDMLVAINGTPITDLGGAQIRAALADSNLSLTIVRNGQTLTLR
ncbi:MAG: aspartyl protease family protein [Acidobacteria bacterium]|nr:aspartyl protease family protein [Acidobacteriota bacterium]